jgi:hypothetical protein
MFHKGLPQVRRRVGRCHLGTGGHCLDNILVFHFQGDAKYLGGKFSFMSALVKNHAIDRRQIHPKKSGVTLGVLPFLFRASSVIFESLRFFMSRQLVSNEVEGINVFVHREAIK